jgi:predicted Holliday junction resolvase-like endonuclease
MNRLQTTLRAYELQRQIFFVCPHSGDIVRLSTCRITKSRQPDNDWLARLEAKERLLDMQASRWREREQEARNEAGRRASRRLLNTFDSIFRPHKLSVQDARMVCHPVDYILFKGLRSEAVKEVILMNKRSDADKDVQESIREVIAKNLFRWATFRLDTTSKRVIEE